MMENPISEDKNTRDLAMAMHLLAFSGMVFPFGNLLGPLVLWLMKREESVFLDFHGREVLNFQISLVIWYAVSGILAFILVGFVLMAILALMSIIWTIMGALRASSGEYYHYPITIRFLK